MFLYFVLFKVLQQLNADSIIILKYIFLFVCFALFLNDKAIFEENPSDSWVYYFVNNLFLTNLADIFDKVFSAYDLMSPTNSIWKSSTHYLSKGCAQGA